MTQATFFWHDYETWGINPASDRPSQFAGIRTDAELNPVGKPIMLYCQPTPDYLPSIDACLVTGITPQEAQEKGVSEAEFIARIHQELATPNTCTVGYNNINFDDEVTRHTLFRNFYDPYAREWQNSNSRFDLINVARLCYALRPEGVEWPQRDDGAPSFKLEHLTAANGISHEDAHDALSDVHATIDMAKVLRHAQPKLFDYALSLRSKASVQQKIDLAKQTPLVHISGKYSAERHCAGFVMPLLAHPTNRNSVIVWDLCEDPTPLLTLPAEELRELLFTPNAEMPADKQRPALKEIRANRVPMVAPASVLNDNVTERLGWDMALFRQRWIEIRNAVGLAEKVSAVYQHEREAVTVDVEESLYHGSFLSPEDQRLRNQVQAAEPYQLAELQYLPFADDRLPELLWRYRCRNFPQTLSTDEIQQWYAYCRKRLTNPEKRNLKQLQMELAQRSISAKSADERQILSAIIDYVDGVAKQVGL